MSEKYTERSTGLPTRLPKGKRGGSLLAAETKSMERKRRLAEQQGASKWARVNARAHSEEEKENAAPEEGLENGILQHPELDSQRFDGVSPDIAPPSWNRDARRKFDNEQRDQQQEKQLRLGNMPKFSPTPRGP